MPCRPAGKPPHIILIHDELSFDIRMAPGIKVPSGYGPHFKSFDGKERNFLVEGAGGPSWYTEYNVLEGLSARSFGRFAYFVTRIAAGRVKRGLPAALRRCGYRTFSLYPALGAFMSARSFQATTGVQRFYDQHDLGTREHRARQLLLRCRRAHDRAGARARPDVRFRLSRRQSFSLGLSLSAGPDAAVEGFGQRAAGRRISAPAGDERAGLFGLPRAAETANSPTNSFLLVRFGDHQPDFAAHLIEPELDDSAIAHRLMAYDPRYFTTYYAIDAINFTPVDVSSALETLEGPYLPLVVQEAAGLPLDPSFAEQKKIFVRCRGTILCLLRRRGGASFQPHADRRRSHQESVVGALSRR